MSTSHQLLIAFSVVLGIASPVRADIGVIVAEPVSALGFFTRVGHVATYLSRICPDGSPIRMRVCLPGESGGVVIRSSRLSEHEDYDWAIVPFEEYLQRLADLIATPGRAAALQRFAGHLAVELPAVVAFVFDPSVDATNWRAEQAIRPAVVNRKVSGGNRSRRGADTQQILTSVVQTTRLRHLDPRVVVAGLLHARQPSISAHLAARQESR